MHQAQGLDTLACSTRDLPACGYGIDFGDVTAIMLDLHDEYVHLIKPGPGRVEVEKQGAMSDRCALPRGFRRQQLGLASFTRMGVLKQESLHSHQGVHMVCIGILSNAILSLHNYSSLGLID